MKYLSKLSILKLIVVINLLLSSVSYGDNHNIAQILELIQKDIKTLEKAVYSSSEDNDNNTLSSSNLNDKKSLNSHLLNNLNIKGLPALGSIFLVR